MEWIKYHEKEKVFELKTKKQHLSDAGKRV